MTRTQKQGINSFLISVDFFDNPKICAVTVEHGIKGQAATMMLLCAIYRNGYFIEWTPENYITILKELPGIKVKKMQKIVETLVEWGFFDRSLFEKHQVLTSLEIQQHFIKATGLEHNTTDTSLPYWLADEDDNEDGNMNENNDVTEENAKDEPCKDECNDDAPEETYSYDIKYDTKQLIRILKKDRKWKENMHDVFGYEEVGLMKRLDEYYQYLVSSGKDGYYYMGEIQNYFEIWHYTGKIP